MFLKVIYLHLEWQDHLQKHTLLVLVALAAVTEGPRIILSTLWTSDAAYVYPQRYERTDLATNNQF